MATTAPQPLPTQNKGTAILLALILGGIGAHKFYMGQVVRGMLYLVFCWTFVPLILACVFIVHMMLISDAAFRQKCR